MNNDLWHFLHATTPMKCSKLGTFCFPFCWYKCLLIPSPLMESAEAHLVQFIHLLLLLLPIRRSLLVMPLTLLQSRLRETSLIYLAMLLLPRALTTITTTSTSTKQTSSSAVHVWLLDPWYTIPLMTVQLLPAVVPVDGALDWLMASLQLHIQLAFRADRPPLTGVRTSWTSVSTLFL